MEDTNRILERKALRNVRALVDKLERADNPHEWRVVVLFAALMIALVIVLWISVHVYAARESAAREQLSCQMEIWLEKSGHFERGLREVNPNLSSREIQLQLKRERPFIMANAKIACDGRAK